MNDKTDLGKKSEKADSCIRSELHFGTVCCITSVRVSGFKWTPDLSDTPTTALW